MEINTLIMMAIAGFAGFVIGYLVALSRIWDLFEEPLESYARDDPMQRMYDEGWIEHPEKEHSERE